MFSHERVLLGYQLCSARMLLGRPYLNARRQTWGERNEATFGIRMGNSCVEAAKAVVDFLPDDLDAHFIYDQSPWWCIVHHMMQAVFVLLLGLSYPTSTSQDSMLLVRYIKKVIRCLQVMQDSAAERAYLVAVRTFETVLRRQPVDLAGMWKAESACGNDLQQAVDLGMTSYVPTQYVPQATLDAVSNETAIFVDNYYMRSRCGGRGGDLL
jgi:hypothetical protein